MEKVVLGALGTPLDLDTTGVWGAVGFLIGSTGVEIMQIVVDTAGRRATDILGSWKKPTA
ncbi:MAG: hypothetical protein K0S56_4392 [Microvirga sp.]|jgi:hypothetical protein|nr:hypothetical protein [Microvirga sp.]